MRGRDRPVFSHFVVFLRQRRYGAGCKIWGLAVVQKWAGSLPVMWELGVILLGQNIMIDGFFVRANRDLTIERSQDWG